MPTYDYECTACGHTFDELQSFSEPPLTKCPACKKNKLHRLFGGGGAIIFKGSGFYETDYRKESYSKAEKAESDGGKTETKADAPAAGGAKPATPAAPAAPSAGSSGGGSTSAKGGGKSGGKGGKATRSVTATGCPLQRHGCPSDGRLEGVSWREVRFFGVDCEWLNVRGGAVR